MAGLNVNKAEFIKSAASTQQFIRSSIPAIAFAGKSNVGKSSVINRMLNRKNFARVGAQPGKTIHVNYFFIVSINQICLNSFNIDLKQNTSMKKA